MDNTQGSLDKGDQKPSRSTKHSSDWGRKSPMWDRCTLIVMGIVQVVAAALQVEHASPASLCTRLDLPNSTRISTFRFPVNTGSKHSGISRKRPGPLLTERHL